MEDKCFCHFNGFAVKDAKARQEIENIKTTYATKEELNSIEVPSVEPVIIEGTAENVSIFKTEGVETAINWTLVRVGKHCILRVSGDIPKEEEFEFYITIPDNPTILGGSCSRSCFILGGGQFKMDATTTEGYLQIMVVGYSNATVTDDTVFLSDQIEFYVE